MRLILVSTFALWFVSCTSPTEPTDDTPNTTDTRTLTIEARPNAIPADGVSTLTVFVEYHVNGEPVADSTRIILLNPMGSLAGGTIYTVGGVALDTLTSDTLAGLGWLIAYSEGIRDSVEIMFTSVDAGPNALTPHSPQNCDANE